MYNFSFDLTTSLQSRIITFVAAFVPHVRAEVAELADALRSGRSEGDLVWVQVPLSAPFAKGIAEFSAVSFLHASQRPVYIGRKALCRSSLLGLV